MNSYNRKTKKSALSISKLVDWYMLFKECFITVMCWVGKTLQEKSLKTTNIKMSVTLQHSHTNYECKLWSNQYTACEKFSSSVCGIVRIVKNKQLKKKKKTHGVEI